MTVEDIYSGLVGPIIITRKGETTSSSNLRPYDVDREFVSFFMVSDENASPYVNTNINSFTNRWVVDTEDDDFIESNLMHGINGYLYGNLPGLKVNHSHLLF